MGKRHKHRHDAQSKRKPCPNCKGTGRRQVSLWNNISEGHLCLAPVMCIACDGRGWQYEDETGACLGEPMPTQGA